jgi:hypothetical protein
MASPAPCAARPRTPRGAAARLRAARGGSLGSVGTTTATCARCGRPVGWGEHLCAQCREEAALPVATRPAAPERLQDERRRRWPENMPRPSPVQYHATVMIAVALVLAGLALFAFLNHRGVGPFQTSSVQVAVRGPDAATVTFTVSNEGSRSSRANCRVVAEDASANSLGEASILTDEVPGHGAIRVTARVGGLSAGPTQALVTCT